MKIGILTSSRADFGIYIPLLKALRKDPYFVLEIIAFGTHLSKNHGYTINEIKDYGFTNIHEVATLPSSDSPEAIANCIGETINSFATFWDKNNFDLVFALGDRYEMFAAVSASTPFTIKIAHLHAGETTLGAIDNGYRHSISLFSKYLFVSNEGYYKRALEIVGTTADVYNVGALSIDNLSKLSLLNKEQFFEKFKIDLNKPSILFTFHPETVAFEKNKEFIEEIIAAFKSLIDNWQIIITLPNIDTMGEMIREELIAFGQDKSNVQVVESFGMLGYLSCMKYCAFMLGNTSSGFVEASYFPKYVLNLGERQKGRLTSENIINVPIQTNEILKAIETVKNLPVLENEYLYGKGDTASRIVKILKEINE